VYDMRASVDDDLAQPWACGLLEGNVVVGDPIDEVFSPSLCRQWCHVFKEVVHHCGRASTRRFLPWLVDTVIRGKVVETARRRLGCYDLDLGSDSLIAVLTQPILRVVLLPFKLHTMEVNP